jgi:hypothetical protein
MGPEAILLIAGLIFLGAAASGGGFEVREISVPSLERSSRVWMGLVGALAVAGAFYLILDAVRTVDAAAPAAVADVPDEGSTSEDTPSSVTPPEHDFSAVEEGDAEASEPVTTDQEVLLAALPTGLAANCLRSEFGIRELGTRASLECHMDRELQVDYHWFVTPERMHAVFDTDVENADVKPGLGCQVDGWPGTGRWNSQREAHAGRVLCFERGEEARIVWTYDEIELFAHAVHRGDALALRDWWLENRALAQVPE